MESELNLNKKKSKNIVESTYKSFPFLFFLLILLISLPTIPIVKIEGLYQPIRSDFILMATIWLLFLIKSVILGKIKITWFLLLFFIITSSIYFLTSSSFIVAAVQLIGYGSIIISYPIIMDVIEKNRFKEIIKYFSLVLYIQIFIHFLGMLGISYDIVVGEKTYHLFGRYGTFGMPFKFGLFCLVSAFIFTFIEKNRLVVMTIIILAVLTSDSRISMLSLFLYLFLALPRWTPALGILSFASVIFFNSGKFSSMLSTLSAGISTISVDGSLVMRVVNLERYFDWVDLEKFLLGGGALSYLQYGTGYGGPGPLDITFLRLITEFGVIITLIILFLFLRLVSNMSRNTMHFLGLFIAIVTYSIFNEGIMALRSGHYFFAVAALAVSLNKKSLTKNRPY